MDDDELIERAIKCLTRLAAGRGYTISRPCRSRVNTVGDKRHISLFSHTDILAVYVYDPARDTMRVKYSWI